MSTALKSYQKLAKRRGLLATTLIQIYSAVRRYSRAIDVFVQSDPTVASLVWGSVRVLLEVSERQNPTRYLVPDCSDWRGRRASIEDCWGGDLGDPSPRGSLGTDFNNIKDLELNADSKRSDYPIYKGH